MEPFFLFLFSVYYTTGLRAGLCASGAFFLLYAFFLRATMHNGQKNREKPQRLPSLLPFERQIPCKRRRSAPCKRAFRERSKELLPRQPVHIVCFQRADAVSPECRIGGLGGIPIERTGKRADVTAPDQRMMCELPQLFLRHRLIFGSFCPGSF